MRHLDLGYKSCETDPDLWMKKELKPEFAIAS